MGKWSKLKLYKNLTSSNLFIHCKCASNVEQLWISIRFVGYDSKVHEKFLCIHPFESGVTGKAIAIYCLINPLKIWDYGNLSRALNLCVVLMMGLAIMIIMIIADLIVHFF